MSPDFDNLDFRLLVGDQMNPFRRVAEFGVDLIDGCVATTQPDDRGGCPADLVPIRIIGVLCDDHEVMLLGVIPDRQIIRFVKTDRADMDGVREKVLQQTDQTVAQVLVEEQLHAVAATR